MYFNENERILLLLKSLDPALYTGNTLISEHKPRFIYSILIFIACKCTLGAYNTNCI